MTQKPDLRPTEVFIEFFKLFRSLPRRASKASDDYWKGFQQAYMSSGNVTYIDDYIHKAKFMTAMSFIAFSILSLLPTILLRMNPIKIILIALATALIGTSITGFAFITYPYYKRGEARGKIEDGLVYFLSYMAVLSASGMSIERILDRITDVEDNPPLISLAKRFIMDVRLFGMDVRSALKDIAQMSPSNVLSKQIEGIRTTIVTSGDLKNLLTFEVDRQLQVKKEKLKAKINTLVYIGELYVALMIVTPTIFIIVIAILSVLGGGGLGGSSVLQLNIIVFIGIPIMAAVFTVLLDQTLGREE